MRAIAIMSLCLREDCNTMNGLDQDVQNAGLTYQPSRKSRATPATTTELSGRGILIASRKDFEGK